MGGYAVSDQEEKRRAEDRRIWRLRSGETPQEHIRNALTILVNPYHEAHGSRSFNTEQVADMSRLLWHAVNILEGRVDP